MEGSFFFFFIPDGVELKVGVGGMSVRTGSGEDLWTAMCSQFGSDWIGVILFCFEYLVIQE